MKKMVIIVILSLLLLLPLVLIAACQQQPEPAPPTPSPAEALPPTPAPVPAPTPAPAPAPKPAPIVDEPKLSEDEVCVLIWNRIPNQLPGGYSKSDLSKNTRTAEYKGDGEWLFSASGNVRQEGPVTTETVKAEDCWVDRESCNITSYDLCLIAVYFEKSQTLDISVEKQNEKVITETSDTPILRKEIKLLWQSAKGTAHHCYLEGQIENTGKIPISGLSVEYALFNEEGELLTIEEGNITPDTILPGEKGKFRYDFLITGGTLARYDFRFVLETGGVFEYLEGSGEKYYSGKGEAPIFYYEMTPGEAKLSL